MKQLGILILIACCAASCHKHRYTAYTTGELIHFDSTSKLQNEKILKLVEPYKVQIDSQMNQVIGYCAQSMSKYRPESPLGNAVVDMLINYTQEKLSINPDLCIMNFGGLRTALNPGEISRGKVFELMPFDNSLVLLELSPQQLDQLAAHILLRGGDPIGGSRPVRITAENGYAQFNIDQAINTKSSYQIITSNYLASGGDGFAVFTKSAKKTDLNVLIRDVLAYQFEHKTSKDQPLTAVVEGRIPNIKNHE